MDAIGYVLVGIAVVVVAGIAVAVVLLGAALGAAFELMDDEEVL